MTTLEFIKPLPENPVLQGGDVEARNQIVNILYYTIIILKIPKFGDFH